jgi:hypothetical protein
MFIVDGVVASGFEVLYFMQYIAENAQDFGEALRMI